MPDSRPPSLDAGDHVESPVSDKPGNDEAHHLTAASLKEPQDALSVTTEATLDPHHANQASTTATKDRSSETKTRKRMSPTGPSPVDYSSSNRTRSATRSQHDSHRQSSRRSAVTRQPTMADIFHAASDLVRPEKKIGQAPSVWQSLKAIFLSSWLNVLLVFIPISWAMNFALPHSFENRDTLVFVFTFLAIIPLAKLLGFATEELAMRVGQTLAGLLNATLGNAVELIVAIIALVKCELRIVQASLAGSIISNLLLVLGMCFFAGGLKFSEQGFGLSSSQLNSSLLTISVIGVLLPAAFHFSAPQLDDATEARDILAVSRGTAVLLLIIYIAFLLFHLYSHAALFDEVNEEDPATKKYKRKPFRFRKGSKKEEAETEEAKTPTSITNGDLTAEPEPFRSPAGPSVPHSSVTFAEPNPDRQDLESGSTSSEESIEQPQMSLLLTIILLVTITVLVAVTAEFLVDSINGLTDKGNISTEFVGFILLPIVGNAAEHVTAVTVSVKDKLRLSLGVAVGSSIQIALFVIPFIVILGWIIGKPMTLLFDPYESVVMFFSVLTVNYVVQDGKSNWLEGFILMVLYFILSVTFWFYPGSDPAGVLSTCH